MRSFVIIRQLLLMINERNDRMIFAHPYKNFMLWIDVLLSARFASLPVIHAKMGVKNIDSDLATPIGTMGILVLMRGIAFFKGNAQAVQPLTTQNSIFLVLSGCATGVSWEFIVSTAVEESIAYGTC
jgi:uncharacterized membrane protein